MNLRTIEGYVLTAKDQMVPPREWLFGPNTGRSHFHHQSFLSNGLVPFSSYELAWVELPHLEARTDNTFTQMGIAQVKLEIVPRDSNLLRETFTDRRDLIVHAEREGWIRLVGPAVNKDYATRCEDIETNGFRPFSSHRAALEGVYQMERQAQHHSTIASFEMKRLLVGHQLGLPI